MTLSYQLIKEKKLKLNFLQSYLLMEITTNLFLKKVLIIFLQLMEK